VRMEIEYKNQTTSLKHNHFITLMFAANVLRIVCGLYKRTMKINT
jgi:hypothetical protein